MLRPAKKILRPHKMILRNIDKKIPLLRSLWLSALPPNIATNWLNVGTVRIKQAQNKHCENFSSSYSKNLELIFQGGVRSNLRLYSPPESCWRQSPTDWHGAEWLVCHPPNLGGVEEVACFDKANFFVHSDSYHSHCDDIHSSASIHRLYTKTSLVEFWAKGTKLFTTGRNLEQRYHPRFGWWDSDRSLVKTSAQAPQLSMFQLQYE